jgi:hypothetical protein
MQKGLVKGMVIGGLVATSISMMMNSDRMYSRHGRRAMRKGRSFLRKSSNIIGDVVELFR